MSSRLGRSVAQPPAGLAHGDELRPQRDPRLAIDRTALKAIEGRDREDPAVRGSDLPVHADIVRVVGAAPGRVDLEGKLKLGIAGRLLGVSPQVRHGPLSSVRGDLCESSLDAPVNRLL